MANKSSESRSIPGGLNFLFGGLSGMGATMVVQPLDMIKTRMQLSKQGQSSFAVARDILAKEGVFAIYKGLSAGLLRQATYTTSRLGVFNYVSQAYEEHFKKAPNFSVKVMLGTAAGSIAGFIGTPADVALIRMTADGRLPPEKRRNYKHVFDALLRIVKEEGVTKLWRGAGPTSTRAAVVNSVQLSTYAQAREVFIKFIPEGLGLHFCASMLSGLVTSAASLPVDIIKTKIQRTAKGESQIGVITSLIKEEGVFAFWKGFLPYYARLGPHTVITFIIFEQLTTAYLRLSAPT